MLELVLTFAASTLLFGQEPQLREIIVEGEGVVERVPDQAILEFSIRIDGDSREEALSLGETRMQAVRDALAGLAVIETFELATREASTSERFPRQCSNRNFTGEIECTVIGYRFNRTVSLTVGPAEAAGSTLSMLNDTDVTDVSLSYFSLSDRSAAQREADEAAFADARAKAERLAAAMGAELGGVVRLQAGAGFQSRDLFSAEEYEIAFDRIAEPRVEVNLEVQPVLVRSTVTVAFEIIAD